MRIKREALSNFDAWKDISFFTLENIYQLSWYFAAVSIAPTRRIELTQLAVSNWARKLAFVLNLNIKKETPVPQKPGLIISNHTSYHDIAVIGSLLPTIFVSKESVKWIPIIGQAAWIVGIIFLNRKNKKSRKAALQAIETRLQEGVSVVNFPEGTTTPIGVIGKFKPGLFSLLLGNNTIPIYPLYIHYDNPAVEWINKEPMKDHFLRVHKLGRIVAHAYFGEPFYGSQFAETTDLVAHAYTEMKKLGETALNNKIKEGLQI